jgi:hypothetical protein
MGTDRLASFDIGIPINRRAPSAVRSTCTHRADPPWPTSTGPSVMPATNEPRRRGEPPTCSRCATVQPASRSMMIGTKVHGSSRKLTGPGDLCV